MRGEELGTEASKCYPIVVVVRRRKVTTFLEGASS